MVTDKNGEKEELAQIVLATIAEYKAMGNDAMARVIAGRIQSAGYKKETAP